MLPSAVVPGLTSVQVTSEEELGLSHFKTHQEKCPADNKPYTLPYTGHIMQGLPSSALQSTTINVFLTANHLCQLLVIKDN